MAEPMNPAPDWQLPRPNAGLECLHGHWAYRVTRCLHLGDEWLAELGDDQGGKHIFVAAGTADDERRFFCYDYEDSEWEQGEAALLDGSLRQFVQRKTTEMYGATQ